MASRENQGLHIALILLVMLTVGLCLISYVFYSKAETQRSKAESATKQLATVTTDRDNALNRAQTLSYMITGQGKSWNQIADALANIPASDSDDESMTAIRRSFQNNMMLFGPADQETETARNYESLPAFLLSRIRDLNQQLSDLRRSENQLTQQKADLEKSTADLVKKYQDGEQEARDQLAAEREKFNKDLGGVRKTMEGISGQISQKDQQLVDLQSKLESQQKASGDRIDEMAKTIDDFRNKIRNAAKTSFEVPDAVVTSVNQQEGILYIDVGSADNLNVEQTFSVFDKGTTGVMQAKPKGRIEVIQILGEHMAMCRVLEDQLTNIIMPGDLVFTPAWTPGQRIHFAIAGYVDITGSGHNDVKLLTKLIELNGGVVDPTVSVNTRYLIQGEDRSESPTGEVDQSQKDDYQEKLKAAIEIGVDRLSPDKLLNLMGWRADVKTLTLGSGDAVAGAGSQAEGKKEEKASAFRKRTPPRGTDGAF